MRSVLQYRQACKTELGALRLEKALVANPNDRNILEALASFQEARGESAAAKRYAERLKKVSRDE